MILMDLLKSYWIRLCRPENIDYIVILEGIKMAAQDSSSPPSGKHSAVQPA
jgi:hypothetical protein